MRREEKERGDKRRRGEKERSEEKREEERRGEKSEQNGEGKSERYVNSKFWPKKTFQTSLGAKIL
jgi:hypothetical protein